MKIKYLDESCQIVSLHVDFLVGLHQVFLVEGQRQVHCSALNRPVSFRVLFTVVGHFIFEDVTHSILIALSLEVNAEAAESYYEEGEDDTAKDEQNGVFLNEL